MADRAAHVENPRVGEVLARARRHQGHSLRAVEKATGMPNAHISQIETGTILRPNAERLLALAEFYNLDFALLCEWTGYPRLAALARRAESSVTPEAPEEERV